MPMRAASYANTAGSAPAAYQSLTVAAKKFPQIPDAKKKNIKRREPICFSSMKPEKSCAIKLMMI